jgi:cell shape-determining protein MreD
VETKDYLRHWRENRLFFHPSIWFVCGLFVVLRGTIAHLSGIAWLDFDLVPVFLVYLIAIDQDLKALCLALFVGLLTDMFSACQLGLFAFTYTAILLAINRTRRFLDLANVRTATLLVALFLLAKWCFVSIVLRILPLTQSVPSINFVAVIVSAFIMGVIAPILFYVLDVIRGKEERAHA